LKQFVHRRQQVSRLKVFQVLALPACLPDAWQRTRQQVRVIAVAGDVGDDHPQRAVGGVPAREPIAAIPIVADALVRHRHRLAVIQRRLR
jgi:hypothetical protein